MPMLLLTCFILIAPNLSVNDIKSFNTRLIAELERVRYEKEFNLFASHLGYKESSNNWKIVNSIGCIGAFQFSKATLKHLGYAHITPTSFKANPDIFPPELQVKVLKQLIKANERLLQYHMEYIGKDIKGIEVTKAGILAAAHLGGAGSIKLYLESNGSINKRDIYGTKISMYLKEFALYDL